MLEIWMRLLLGMASGGFDKKTACGQICYTHLKSHPLGLSKVKINSIIKPHHIRAPKEEHDC
jgi:hypothetical protein